MTFKGEAFSYLSGALHVQTDRERGGKTSLLAVPTPHEKSGYRTRDRTCKQNRHDMYSIKLRYCIVVTFSHFNVCFDISLVPYPLRPAVLESYQNTLAKHPIRRSVLKLIILRHRKHQLIYVDYHTAKVGNGSPRFSETLSYLIDRITLLIA